MWRQKQEVIFPKCSSTIDCKTNEYNYTNMNDSLLFYKSTQNIFEREAATVRKTTILGDALLTFSCYEGGWSLVW